MERRRQEVCTEGGGRGMRLYMWVSKDKYQLPLFVSEKVEEVARVSGRNINTVYSSISKQRYGVVKNSQFLCVEVD